MTESEEQAERIWLGFRFCWDCLMFHEFPDELKKNGVLPKDHAYCIPQHLSAEARKDHLSFPVVFEDGRIFVASKRDLIAWIKTNAKRPCS